MKKLFTLVLGLATLVAVNAQGTQRPVIKADMPANKPTVAKPQSKLTPNNDARAAEVPMVLDYDGVDDAYATLTSGGTMTRYAWAVNKNFPVDSTYTFNYAVVVYDTLLSVDPSTGETTTFPKSQASFTLDELAIPYIHRNVSGQNDTITISVLSRTGLVIPQGFPNSANVTGTVLWDTTIITNVSLNDDQAFSKQFSAQPQLNFAAGETFAVRFDFAGPVQDQMLILVSYRDDCGGECVAAAAAAGENTVVKANIQGNNIFTGEGIITDCNDNNTFDLCELFYFQNAVFLAGITAQVNYGATISSNVPAACPGEQVLVTANGFGSEATPLTYSWSTSAGNLSSTSDQQVNLTMPATGNAVLTVTVTDANNVTTSASLTVTSRGINIQFSNSTNPVALNCGSSASLTTLISGNTQGRNYSWSTGASGANVSNQSVSFPGTYRVTVTNNSNCSATASIVVNYANGTTNTATFNAPTDVNTAPNAPGIQVCPNTAVTFVNTSAKTSNGWNANWNYGDGQTGTFTDGSNVYTASSQYQVTLTMDSAGCAFVSAPLTINVITPTACAALSINDVEFSNDVTLMPNPTTGNVTLTVSGVEKALNVKVYNILGSEVYGFNTAEVSSTMNKTMDLSALSSGTYLVKVQTGNKIAIKRVTVSK